MHGPHLACACGYEQAGHADKPLVYLDWDTIPGFRRNKLPPSSESRNDKGECHVPPKRQTTASHTHLHVLLSARSSWARSHVCGEGQFSCNKSRICVPQYKNCDTRRDCPDGSDEWNCCKYSHSVAASRRCVCLVPCLLTIISIPE